MPENMLNRAHSRPLTKQRRIAAVAGVAAFGTAAVALSAAAGHGGTVTTGSPATTAQVSSVMAPKSVKGTDIRRLTADSVKLDALAARKKAADATTAAKVAEQKRAAARKAARQHAAEQAATRSTQRLDIEPVAAKTYTNNLDGWIRQALSIMRTKGIPGSYSGLHRNIMRESSGNPLAINNWDVNAVNGIPSKGLLQVIPPTFSAYHVAGTSWNIYDPVANITAAANYAAHRYGSIDNVNSAY
ncbi:transglycosylase SLT domain-containing protein [Streptomyces achromogenes]|uniref:transglycosylase SLT domain-containing protein n=1 Tax=Streptomyces achromogenes TaxID=67255 RepID=UPI00367AB733